MKEELRIDIVGLAGACSYALDCIEAELVKIKNKHGKRVAYISVCMAEYLAIQGDALQDLAMCALLHDNALTQYITEELERNYVIDIKKDLSVRKTNLHCIYGEKNITKLPFKTDVSNVILYHHEHADGTGPFQKKWNETPLPARIIHLADTVDIIGNSIKSDDNRWDFICQYLSQKKDSLFDSECVNAFLHVFTKESYMCLSDDSFETKLWKIIPREKMVFDWEMCKNVADFFAKIVDYKSSFTSRHSIGVAEKASLLAKYMGYDSITVQKMYLAGALHDIGKMAVAKRSKLLTRF
jgi:HD-GYP domain-containing protein (c-di-GMP phosphodiesterase class II)